MTQDAILERGLPADPETERLVLGALMLDPGENLGPIVALLTPDDWSIEAHRRIFAAALAVHERGGTPDRVSVYHELQAREQAESIGGLSYLVSLDDGLPRLYDLDGYAGRLRELAARRRLIATLHAETGRAVLDQSTETAELVEQAQAALAGISANGSTRRGLRTVGEIISETGVDRLLNPSANQEGGIQLPWPSVAQLIPAFRAGQLAIIAARPGVGKSAMAGQIAHRAAQVGAGVAFFSLEMSGPEIIQRLACGLAGVDSHRARYGRLTPTERADLQAAASELAELPLSIDDETGATVGAVAASVRALHARRRLGLVVVDYLQLMTSPGRRENRNVEVSEISRGLKRLAREMRVPVLALAQLNRDSERLGRRPMLTDLRDSGSIEQDADIVTFLHQAERDLDGPITETEVLIAKHRGGPVGKRKLAFHRSLTMFREMTHARP